MKAAIFDMDGLLIDSEPLWQAAEVDVFRQLGVPLTREMCRQTIGIRVDGVVRHWHERFPWEGPSLEAVAAQIVETVAQLIGERGALLPGVRESIDLLRNADYVLAVASSSPLVLIRAALEQLQVLDEFAVVHSAEAEAEGKPHPAVYLTTMARLDVDPAHCIAFEDSIAGIRSAKSAGAWVIAVPDEVDRTNPDVREADVVLDSMTGFSLDLVEGRRVDR